MIQQHNDLWNLENIMNIIPALFSLIGIFLYYYCFKRHLTRKFSDVSEFDATLILYVFFDVSFSVFFIALVNASFAFG